MQNTQPVISAEKMDHLLRSKEFKKLVSERWLVSLGMTFLMCLVYFGFILTVAFNKEFLAKKLGAHLSVGLPIGVGIISFAWLLTGMYVLWANRRYDRQVEELKSQLMS
jgi:uncharacterized membrane protein (DUF485 family)